jgi:hypothetical protein
MNAYGRSVYSVFFPRLPHKQRRTHQVVAIRAVAHRLARASDFIMRDQVEFDEVNAFG